MQCTVTDCSNKVIARNLCQTHYDRQRRYGDLRTRPKSFTCNGCGNTSPMSTFGNLTTHCKACQVERHRIRVRNDRRRKGLWEQYKMTITEYEAMYAAQNGVCAICSKTTKGRGEAKNTLAVDHNHTTGKIRGSLCSHCNTALGLFKDNVDLLESAKRYLTERDNNGNV
jgi:hypothetical protein